MKIKTKKNERINKTVDLLIFRWERSLPGLSRLLPLCDSDNARCRVHKSACHPTHHFKRKLTSTKNKNKKIPWSCYAGQLLCPWVDQNCRNEVKMRLGHSERSWNPARGPAVSASVVRVVRVKNGACCLQCLVKHWLLNSPETTGPT